MEAASSSEISVHINLPTRRHIADNRNPQKRLWEGYCHYANLTVEYHYWMASRMYLSCDISEPANSVLSTLRHLKCGSWVPKALCKPGKYFV